MRRQWFLAFFGFVALAVAAVWLGGLNQDEGWYLYAANLVSEGQIPYRDFFFTQGPVMPLVYSTFAVLWKAFGLLGGRILTLLIGFVGIIFLVVLSRRLVPASRRTLVGLVVFLLLGCNLYHLYYNAIPKTYALAGLFVAVGFLSLSYVDSRRMLVRVPQLFVASAAFAFAAGTRFSLGVILVVVGLGLLVSFRRYGWSFLWFGLGGTLALALVFGVFLLNEGTRNGLIAAQFYHAARGGFDPVFALGSVSRLVRWYLPTFIILGLGLLAFRPKPSGNRDESSNPLVVWLLLWSAVGVVVVQVFAPFPYEDYQVPVMGILSVFAAVLCVRGCDPATEVGGRRIFLLTLGLTWATSFGSPLLEDWMTNGQDRFWTLKKSSCELAQLRDVARRIESLDPGGKTIFTQDLYLAVETNRRVPHGLEMGPFSYWGDGLRSWMKEGLALDDNGMRELIEKDTSSVAALSGYAFAITVPRGTETPWERQKDYLQLLKRQYELAFVEENFGQHATPLLVLKRRPVQMKEANYAE